MNPKGTQIVKRRMDLKYNQKFLANLCGVSSDHISRLEHDLIKKPISDEECQKLAEALQCSVDYLFGLTDKPQQSIDGKTMPFSIDSIAREAVKLYKLVEKDTTFADDLIYMQNHFSTDEINIVKQVISLLRKNHEQNVALKKEET